MTIRSLTASLVLGASLVVTTGIFIGCDNKPKTASDKMHDAGDDMKDAAHDAKNDVKDAAHDAKNDVKDATH